MKKSFLDAKSCILGAFFCMLHAAFVCLMNFLSKNNQYA